MTAPAPGLLMRLIGACVLVHGLAYLRGFVAPAMGREMAVGLHPVAR